MEIQGKSALVTGAGSGIGRAISLALANAGASVVVADVDHVGGLETVRLIQEKAGNAMFIGADVSTPKGIRSMFVDAGDVDIVCNNAGIMTGDTPGWPEVSLEKIHLVLNTNTAGVIMGTREAVEILGRRGGGVIINTASVAGLGPMPFDPMYSASKAAVINFTQSCAQLNEWKNIRVNAVLPGMVNTPIIAKTGDGVRPAAWLEPAIAATTPLEPEVIAETVLGLIQDDSKIGEAEVVAN